MSILSNTFNQINRDAIAEQMYRRAVSTFQGVKSDGIFSFQPPINILALIFLWPARAFVTPHTYHKIIVFAARFTNLPLLLIIHVVERHFLFREQVYGDNDKTGWRWVLRPWTWLSKLDYFGGTRTELNAVFEYESDIDDDALPGGAFDIHDGVMTPANVEADHSDRSMQLGAGGGAGGGSTGTGTIRGRGESKLRMSDSNEVDIQAIRDRSRQRRTQSMSDWGGTIASTSSTLYNKRRPTILSKLYGYGSSRMNVNNANIHERMPSIPSAAGGSGGVGNKVLNDQDTIRTPNTAGSRISWPLSGNMRTRYDEEEEDEDEDYEATREAAEEERRNMNERLERIEEGQKRIEEALKALGGGD